MVSGCVLGLDERDAKKSGDIHAVDINVEICKEQEHSTRHAWPWTAVPGISLSYRWSLIRGRRQARLPLCAAACSLAADSSRWAGKVCVIGRKTAEE